MKNLLFLAVLVVAVSATAFAQPSGVNSPNTASFITGIQIAVAASPGDWGTLLQGTTYDISPAGDIVPPDGTGSPTVPANLQWDITGDDGALVRVTLTLPPFFQGSLGGFRIPYSVTAISGGWADVPFASGGFYQSFDPRSPVTVHLVAGAATVQLGGVVAVPGNAASDTYNGSFVLTAEYTGF